MSYYEQQIIAATGCDPKVAHILEDTMRHIIFHSTLDWQSKKQFNQGAREAYDVYLYQFGLDKPEVFSRFLKIWRKGTCLDDIFADDASWKSWEKFVKVITNDGQTKDL